MIQTEVEEIESFENRIDNIIDELSLQPEDKEEVRGRLEEHLYWSYDYYQDQGYIHKDSIRRTLEDFGDPAAVVAEYNQDEAKTSWIKDTACLRSVLSVFSLFIVIILLIELGTLAVGLIAFPEWPELSETIRGVFRIILASTSGLVAYRLAMSLGGNPYRFSPYILLTCLLFFFALSVDCKLFVIQTMPDPSWHAFIKTYIPLISWEEELKLSMNVYHFNLDWSMALHNTCERYFGLTLFRIPFLAPLPSQLFVNSVALWVVFGLFLQQRKKLQELSDAAY